MNLKAERMKYDKIVKFNSTVSYPAFRTDIDSDLGKWLSSKNTFGVEPVLEELVEVLYLFLHLLMF